MKSVALLVISVAAVVADIQGVGIGGCVVTGNTLFVNGIKTRNLTSSEMNQLNQYETQLTQFQSDLRTYYKTMQQSQPPRGGRPMGRGGRPMGPNSDYSSDYGNGGDMGAMNYDYGNSASSTTMSTNSNNNNMTRPTPPQKPSFCSDDVATQVLLPGCAVQNNQVFINNQYARDLNSQERQAVQQYEQQMQQYQQYLEAQINMQIQQFMGGMGMGGRFGGSNQNQQNGGQTTTMSSTTANSQTTEPKPPQGICYPIY